MPELTKCHLPPRRKLSMGRLHAASLGPILLLALAHSARAEETPSPVAANAPPPTAEAPASEAKNTVVNNDDTAKNQEAKTEESKGTAPAAEQKADPASTSTASEQGASAPASKEQSDAPAPAESRATLPTSTTAKREGSQVKFGEKEWIQRYIHARRLMLDGRFKDAGLAFSALAKGTGDAEKTRVATEFAQLARDYDARGLTLVSRYELEKSELGAKTSGQRSTDEIALLYINSVIYGVGTGTWMAALTGTDSAAGILLPMVGVTGLAIGAIALVDYNDAFKYGVPQAMSSGMYMGFTQGALWAGYMSSFEDLSAPAVGSLMWGGATAGAALGALLGNALGTTPGRASWVGSSALWTGTVTGFTVGALDDSGEGGLLGAALGHGAGIVGGLLTAGAVAPSIARTRYLDLGGLTGGLAGAGIYAIAAIDNIDGRAFAGITAGGVAVGLATSWVLTRNMPKDELPSERNATGLASLHTSLTPLKGGGQVGLSGLW